MLFIGSVYIIGFKLRNNISKPVAFKYRECNLFRIFHKNSKNLRCKLESLFLEAAHRVTEVIEDCLLRLIEWFIQDFGFKVFPGYFLYQLDTKSAVGSDSFYLL